MRSTKIAKGMRVFATGGMPLRESDGNFGTVVELNPENGDAFSIRWDSVNVSRGVSYTRKQARHIKLVK